MVGFVEHVDSPGRPESGSDLTHRVHRHRIVFLAVHEVDRNIDSSDLPQQIVPLRVIQLLLQKATPYMQFLPRTPRGRRQRALLQKRLLLLGGQ